MNTQTRILRLVENTKIVVRVLLVDCRSCARSPAPLHRGQSAHIAASERALRAADARSAAQAAVDTAALKLKRPRPWT